MKNHDLKIVPTFIFIALVISSSVFAQSGQWELKRNRNRIVIYTRQFENSNIIEFKASTIIKVRKEIMTNIIRDVEKYSEWMSSSFTEINKVQTVNKNEWYVYYQASIPWPFDNRDIVMHVKISENENADVFNLSSTPSFVNEKNGIIRVKKAKGQWTFASTCQGQTRVTYQFYGDPEVSVPAWIMDKMVVEGSFTTMVNLKKIAVKYDRAVLNYYQKKKK